MPPCPHSQEAFDALDPGKGMAYLFALYAVLCMVSIAFVHVCVPETKGKTLEQIEAELCPERRLGHWCHQD